MFPPPKCFSSFRPIFSVYLTQQSEKDSDEKEFNPHGLRVTLVRRVRQLTEPRRAWIHARFSCKGKERKTCNEVDFRATLCLCWHWRD